MATASESPTLLHADEMVLSPNGCRWGHLRASHGLVGVQLTCRPQPHLRFFPALRVTGGGNDRFLETCLQRGDTEDQRWLLLSVDPLDGEVSMRVDLTNDDPTTIDRTLAELQRFFERNYDELAAACRAPERGSCDEGCDEQDEGEDLEEKLVKHFHRLFG